MQTLVALWTYCLGRKTLEYSQLFFSRLEFLERGCPEGWGWGGPEEWQNHMERSQFVSEVDRWARTNYSVVLKLSFISTVFANWSESPKQYREYKSKNQFQSALKMGLTGRFTSSVQPQVYLCHSVIVQEENVVRSELYGFPMWEDSRPLGCFRMTG